MAAAAAGVDTRVVRTWYRSGLVPVRRVPEGGGTRFLVPLDDVVRRADALAFDPVEELAEAERRVAEARKLQLEAEERMDELADLVGVLRTQLTQATRDAGRLRVRVRQLEASLRERDRAREQAAAARTQLDQPEATIDLTAVTPAAEPPATVAPAAPNPWSFLVPAGKGDPDASPLLGLLASLPPVRYLPGDEDGRAGGTPR